MKRSILFEDLFRNHLDYVAGALRRVNCTEDEIEDIIQIAYIRAFDKFGHLNDEASFVPWFTAIAINESYKYRKKKNDERQVWFGKLEELSVIMSENEWSELYVDDNVNSRLLIEEAMEKVPEDYLVPFWLSAIEDYKYREISNILSIKEGTVKSRINRARVLFRELLADVVEDHKKKQVSK